MLGSLRCFFRNRHEPVRHPLGGFRCAVCGTAGADLEDMGFDVISSSREIEFTINGN